MKQTDDLTKTPEYQARLAVLSQHADRVTRYCILGFFVFGLFLIPFYDTWAFGLGIGGLSLTLYLVAQYGLSNPLHRRLVFSATYAFYMLQFIGQMHGMYEMHFFFFTNAALLIIYQDWRVLIPYTLLAIVHHSAFFYLQLVDFDTGKYFISIEGVNLQTLCFHFGVVAFMGAICGYFAWLFRRATHQQVVTELGLAHQMKYLQRSVDFVVALSEGTFTRTLETDDNDQLSTALRRLKHHLVENDQGEEREKFATAGLFEVNQLLRGTHANARALAQALIAFLTRHVGATQGGLLLVEGTEDNDPHLSLTACYAYERQKSLKKRVEIGEGLAGEAVRDKDVLYLTDVPADYVNITSGLGQATPRCLVVVPMLAGERVVGVLEIAALTALEPYQVAFLRKAGDIIAAAFASVQASERTQQLLAQSREQAERMRQQEEEMRQNMEELQATQEEMHRRQTELEDARQRLEQEKNAEIAALRAQLNAH